jgi:DASS family divalent anion:Na+ symporter
VLGGFSNDVNWLVFCAFHIGFAVEKTQLGRRLSLLIVRWLGRSLLGLGYAVFICELLLGPFVPSNTARGGGVMMPLVTAIARTLGSTPERWPRRRGGEFLVLCGAHANLLSASMYATGMAANPLIPKFAKRVFGVEFTYLNWLAGSIVPGLLACVLLPPLLLRLSCSRTENDNNNSNNSSNSNNSAGYQSIINPTEGDYEDRQQQRREFQSKSSTPTQSGNEMDECGADKNNNNSALTNSSSNRRSVDDDDDDCAEPPSFATLQVQVREDLRRMGRLRVQELLLLIELGCCLLLWLTQTWTGLDTHLVAFMTVMALVVTQLITWDDVVRNYKSVDTFFWLGAFIMMATQLGMFGVTQAMGQSLGQAVGKWEPTPLLATVMLAVTYFLSMYVFSALTGHIIAFAEPFMAAAQLLHCPPMLTTALLAYFSTLCGCLTNFSSGPIVIYFAQGYCRQRSRWFGIGLLVGVLYLCVYLTVGLLWWRLIGFW